MEDTYPARGQSEMGSEGQTPPAQQTQEWAQFCGTGQGSPGSLCHHGHTGHESPRCWGQQSCDSHSC